MGSRRAIEQAPFSMGALLGLAVFVACLVAGGILLGNGYVVIGFVVLLRSLSGRDRRLDQVERPLLHLTSRSGRV